MRFVRRHAGGVIGRVFAILLLAVLIEYGISAILYERASRYSIREDEVHRLAEHLVIARKLLAEQPVPQRAVMADELTTNRYLISWHRNPPAGPRVAPRLETMNRQILTWEPSLENSDLRVRLTSPGRNSFIVGGLRLPDQSWMSFSTREPLASAHFVLERVLLALTPAVALILIGGLLVGRTLQPLRRLAVAADRVGHGDVVEVQEDGPGEVRRVIAAFNGMQRRIHRLITDRTQALAAVGHDLRTPLARLQLRADAVADEPTREAMLHDVSEMNAMVGSLLAFLGGDEDSEDPVAVDLASICQTVVDNAQDFGHDAAYSGPDHLEMRLRPVGMKRALANLIDNAIHYAGDATLNLVERGDEVWICVDDNGPGIPEEDRGRVLQPFVRLDRARARDTAGFGLGLPIVMRAVEAEGGHFVLENRAEGGLRAKIILPRPHA